MKKEYISPELLVVEFITRENMLNLGVKSGETATINDALAPGQYNDEEDEEDWEDDGKPSRNGRRGF